MARVQGVSPATVQRIWQAHGLQQKRLHRVTFPSTPDLIAAIREYLEATSANPKPFVWTASVNAILKRVRRDKAMLETLH